MRGYQLLRTGRSSGCRFLPSCSEYAIGAVSAHGALRGTRLATRRLLRCHPFGGHGFDPVPDAVPVAGEGVSCSH
ncbi:MAG: membrane protein insertion efficiency factor YidD [Acidimicrobiales bacterium]